MFKKICWVVTVLAVFFCAGAQGINVSASTREEIITGAYRIKEDNLLVENTVFKVENGLSVSTLISVSSKGVIFKNVEICGRGTFNKVLQTTAKGELTLDGVTIKTGISAKEENVADTGAVSRAVYSLGKMTIKDLVIEDGVSNGVEVDIENGDNPITIEKTNIKSICLNGGSIIVNQNTELENEVKISFKQGSALLKKDNVIVGGAGGISASTLRSKFRLDESLKGKFSLGESEGNLVLVDYDPSLDNPQNEDPESGDNDTPSEEESESGAQGGDTSSEGEPQEPSESEPQEPKEVEPSILENEFIYNGSNQFGKLKATYVLDGKTTVLGVRLVGDSELKNAKEHVVEMYILETDPNLENIQLSKTREIVEVKKKNIEVSLEEASFVYNGEEVELVPHIVGEVVNGDADVKLLGERGENAGSYAVSVSVGSENYILTTADTLRYTIDKKHIPIDNIQRTAIEKTFDGLGYAGKEYVTANGLVKVAFLNGKECINVGRYTLNLKSTLTDSAKENYALPLEANSLTTSLNISPKVITPSLKVNEFVYSGSIPQLELEYFGVVDGFKPQVDVSNTYLNGVGEHSVILSPKSTERTYIFPTSQVELKYQVFPKTITASLVQNVYTYTGSKPSIEVVLSGICGEDEVRGEALADESTRFGSHSCKVALSGADVVNYTLSQETSVLKYTIEKAGIDMSNVEFPDDTVEYTGVKYIPKISNLPSGVNVEFRASSDSCSVGEYSITAYFSTFNPNYVVSVDFLTMTLTIVPKTVDVSGVRLDSLRTVYTGENFSIEPSNLPQRGVEAKAQTETEFTLAGEYTVGYLLVPINPNYILTGKTELSATVNILKADYDISHLEFANADVVWDGTAHSITLLGKLADGLIANETDSYVNAGEYTISQSFTNTNPNYHTPMPLLAKLTIQKRELSGKLEQVEFVYSGKEFEVKLNLTGVLGEGVVTATLSNAKNTLAGTYKAVVLGLDNPNYTLSQMEYTYKISKALVDMSGVSLQDKEFTYNGEEYIPTLCGTMPSFVEYTIVHNEIRNAGEYTVVASFTTDPNHICPSPISAKVLVRKKPVIARFTNYQNLVYTGQEQYISCNITGMVDNEEYSILYSNTPKEVGEYTAEVVLKSDSNYVLWNSSRITFSIHSETTTTTNVDYTITLNGGLFTPTDIVELNCTTLSVEAQNTLNTMHKDIENLNSYEISLEGVSNEVDVSLKLHNLKLSSEQNLILYTLSSEGVLQELDYTLTNGTLNFKAVPNTTLILIQESIDTQNPTSIILIIGITVTLTLALTLLLHTHRKHKHKHN